VSGPKLSRREADFLHRLIQGDTIQQIAEDWHYGESGARSIGDRLRKKLGAKTNAQAVFIACQLKILEPNRRHGDHAGFAAHRYRDEEPCDDCWAGERAYRAGRRQRRRQEGAGDARSANSPTQGRKAARDELSPQEGRPGGPVTGLSSNLAGPPHPRPPVPQASDEASAAALSPWPPRQRHGPTVSAAGRTPEVLTDPATCDSCSCTTNAAARRPTPKCGQMGHVANGGEQQA
jgi:DNA-binding CsgD family transcriptional regulator